MGLIDERRCSVNFFCVFKDLSQWHLKSLIFLTGGIMDVDWARLDLDWVKVGPDWVRVGQRGSRLGQGGPEWVRVG